MLRRAAAMATQNVMMEVGHIETPAAAVMTTDITHLMVHFGVVLLSGNAAEIATAQGPALQISMFVAGFVFGCAGEARGEAVAGRWAFVLPTAIAFFAVSQVIRSTRVKQQ